MMSDEDIRHRRLRQMPTADLQFELDHFEALSAEHTHALREDDWLVQLWREERECREPRDQIRMVLRQELQERGLLEATDEEKSRQGRVLEGETRRGGVACGQFRKSRGQR